jgi:trimeric autotransporter adhesin
MNSFKKLALGIAAALSFATLSAMPSQAAVNADTISIDAATDAVFTGESATAVVTVSFLAQTTSDTVTVTSSVTSLPVGSASLATLSVQETSSAVVVLGSGNYSANIASTANTATYVTAKIKATVDAPSIAGTYVYKFTPSLGTGSTGGVNSAAVVWTVTVTAPDTKASAGTSTSILNKGETISATTDVEVFAPKTVTSDAVAVIAITQKNAAGASASESLTAIVTGPGLIGVGSNPTTISAQGRVITVAAGQHIGVFSDGTSGVGTVTITSASGVVLAVEKVTFYGDIATVITTTAKPVIAMGSNADVVTAVAYDAAGVTVGAGTLYAVSDSASVVSNSYTSATIVDGVAKFTLTGVTSGTAGIKVSTGSTATTTGAVVSNIAPVRVEGSVASVKVAFDKATYAAGELATITVTPTDAKGLVLSGKTFANLFATGGLVSSYAFGAASDSLTAVSVTTDANGVKAYKVYMPLTDVVIKVTATGGTSLPTAAQVEVSATASVVTGSFTTNATLAALVAQVTAMQTMFDAIKAEAVAAKAASDAAKLAADAKAIADRAAFVKQYNALATKWNKKNPKAKVALLKK